MLDVVVLVLLVLVTLSCLSSSSSSSSEGIRVRCEKARQRGTCQSQCQTQYRKGCEDGLPESYERERERLPEPSRYPDWPGPRRLTCVKVSGSNPTREQRVENAIGA